jgi:branched-chain amino acid transport system permease protein
MGQILIQGALLSGLYALIALGFTMIFGVGGVLNLAHAGYVMVAAYMYYMATYVLGLPVAAGFAIAIGVSIALAIATYMGWVRRFLYNPTVVFVSTIILALLLGHIMTLAFFRENINVPPVVEGMTPFMGYTFSNNLIAGVIASWICIAIVLLFVRRTHMGRAMRALAMDRRGAIISGINSDMVNLTTWAISGALAGVAGVFYGSYTFLVPDMWVLPLIMSFAIVVIGGLGSIEGTLVGAHIIGFMETATVLAINDKLRSVPGLVIMIIVLVLRPRGLFGR